MAEINTNCPHCGAELVADEAWIGMEVECPTCNKSFTVAKETPVEKPSVPTLNLPKLTAQNEEPALPTLTPLAPTANTTETEENSFMFVCPACGTQVELPAIMKGKKYECKACAEESIAEATTEKKCPFCGEMIKIKATVCKHCKKSVPPLMGNNSINLQPIGNSAINLQPIQPMNKNISNLQTLQPLSNDVTELHPISPTYMENLNIPDQIVGNVLCCNRMNICNAKGECNV